MALSREYRIRELYLKFLEENFSRDRSNGFRSILGDSEVRLLKRLSKLNDLGDGTQNKAIFNTYLYSLFEVYTRRRRQTSSLKELKRFSRHYAYDTEGGYPKSRTKIIDALTHCKLWELQNEEEANLLVTSIVLFREFIDSLRNGSLSDFSTSLKEFVTTKVSTQLEDESYKEKVRLYGQLIQTPTREAASYLETVRIALQCMPVGNQKSANIFLYIMVKVNKIWPEITSRLLHVPADSDLSRVIFRIGMTQKKLGNLEYGTIGYAAIQTLAKRLIPENPSALYGLKHIAKIWCRSRTTDCDQCPMNSICTYAQSILV